MATQKSIKRRFLAVLVLLTFCAVWIPPPAQAQTTSPVAPIVPIRLPHESVAHSSPTLNKDYVLMLKGSGLPLTSIPFDALDARQICVFWEPDPKGDPKRVIARAYAMASHGGIIAQGWWSVPAYSSQTLDTYTDERPTWASAQLGTLWRSTPVVARPGNLSCATTVGHVAGNGPHDNSWLEHAVQSTKYNVTRQAIRIGVTYFNLRLWYTTELAKHPTFQVQYQRRPSIAWVHYNLSAPATERWTMDVVQEPRVFRGSPHDFWTSPLGHLNFSAAEQQTRWRAFMKADTLNAGIAEGYALGLINTVPGMSGVGALVEAEGNGEPLLRLTTPTDITKLSLLTETATRNKIREALAAPSPVVIVTQAPTTASNGWRGTPWIAWSTMPGQPTALHVGTYLGVLRGAAGPAGGAPAGGTAVGAPPGVTGADIATSQAKTVGVVGAALAGLGFFGNSGAFGPVGRALGHAAYGLAALAGLTAAGLAVTVTVNEMNNATPKTGHVGTDDAGGPAGSAPSGPGSEASAPGIGVNGNGNSPSGGTSGTGGEGEGGVGDPGDD